MNHMRIARTFLRWFAQVSDGADTFYATGTDYVERYRDPKTGVLHNAMDCVRQLAQQRLTPVDASKTISAAARLLRPEMAVSAE
jgi:hypothetical protein